MDIVLAPPMNEDELLTRFKADFKILHQSHERITLKLTPLQAWALMSQVQLASRHPLNTGPTRRIAERIARWLQEQIATLPTLRIVTERGWDPKFDEAHDPDNSPNPLSKEPPMNPQALAIRQLKADALRAGATGVLVIRGMHNPQITFEVEGEPMTLTLEGQMILIADFFETDGGPAGIES